jgi:hypothetical protein
MLTYQDFAKKTCVATHCRSNTGLSVGYKSRVAGGRGSAVHGSTEEAYGIIKVVDKPLSLRYNKKTISRSPALLTVLTSKTALTL